MTRLETRISEKIEESGPLRFGEIVDAVVESGIKRTYLGNMLVGTALDKLVLYRKVERCPGDMYRSAGKGE